jgi:PAS domain S-box-containing protein
VVSDPRALGPDPLRGTPTLRWTLRDVTERRRADEAERQLAAAEAARTEAEAGRRRLEAVLEGTSDAFFRLDAAGRFTYVNGRAARDWEVDPAEVLGRTMAEVFPASAGSEPFRLMRAALEGGSPVRFEGLSPARGRWIEVHAYPSDGELSVFFRDVDERRRVDEERERLLAEAQRQRAFLEAVVEQLPAGVLIAHADGTLALRNAHAESVAGGALAAGAPHADAAPGWHDADGGRLEPSAFPLARALRGERLDAEDFVYACADGARVSLSVNAGPVRGPGGEVTAAVAAFSDVSRRRRAEDRDRVLAGASAALAGSLDSAETLRRVARISAESLASLCLVHLGSGDGVRVRALAHRHPEREDELWALLRLFAGDGDRDGPNPIFHVLAGGGPRLLADVGEADLAAMSSTAEQLDALHRLAPRSALIVPLVARGGTLGALTLVRTGEMPRFDAEDLEVAADLAARAALAVDNARLYEESARAARVRDDMLAVVSHDLRNPIQAVLISSILLRDFPGRPHDERETQQIDIIHRAAEQMARLVDDLVEIAAMEGGALSLRCAPMATEPLLDSAAALIAPAAEAAAVTVVRAPCPPLPPVHADAERVLQVLGNLLSNAVKFTPQGGTVTLAAAHEGDAVRISVADAGPGIAAEHLPHVFDRFWQVRSSRKTAGLGLAIAKTLVEAHGGRVGVDSTPGAGSVFWATFPVARAEEPGGEPKAC